MRIFFYDDLCTIPTSNSGVQPVQVDSDETKKVLVSLSPIKTHNHALSPIPPPPACGRIYDCIIIFVVLSSSTTIVLRRGNAHKELSITHIHTHRANEP